MCFSIDNKNTRAIDDVISIEDLSLPNQHKFWKIGIHIADLNEFVNKGTQLDKEAETRVNSKYIGKYFFKSMLPHTINDDIGSLKEYNDNKGNGPRFAISLFFFIDESGMIVYRSNQEEEKQDQENPLKSQDIAFYYERSVITNDIKLSYNQVDSILQYQKHQKQQNINIDDISSIASKKTQTTINSGEFDNKLIQDLLNKDTQIDVHNLFDKIEILESIMQKRREFRQQFQDVQDHVKQKKKKKQNSTIKGQQSSDTKSEELSPSMNMIEELMLISHTILPKYYQATLDHTKNYLKWYEKEYKLQKQREKEEEIRRKKEQELIKAKKKEEAEQRKKERAEAKKAQQEAKKARQEANKLKKKEKAKAKKLKQLKEQNPETQIDEDKISDIDSDKLDEISDTGISIQEEMSLGELSGNIEPEEDKSEISSDDNENLSSKSSVLSEFNLSDDEQPQDEDYFGLDYDKLKDKASVQSENWLKSKLQRIQQQLDQTGGEDLVNFGSRKEIDQSFGQLKKLSQSLSGKSKEKDLISLYLDVIYRQNYQYFPYFIKRNQQKQKEQKQQARAVQHPHDKQIELQYKEKEEPRDVPLSIDEQLEQEEKEKKPKKNKRKRGQQNVAQSEGSVWQQKSEDKSNGKLEIIDSLYKQQEPNENIISQDPPSAEKQPLPINDDNQQPDVQEDLAIDITIKEEKQEIQLQEEQAIQVVDEPIIIEPPEEVQNQQEQTQNDDAQKSEAEQQCHEKLESYENELKEKECDGQFFEGYQATSKDYEYYKQIKSDCLNYLTAEKYPHTFAWYILIDRFPNHQNVPKAAPKNETKGDKILKQQMKLKLEQSLQNVEMNKVNDHNIEYLNEFLNTSTQEQLKYSNPLRDYAHLLSGRLLNQLIQVQDKIQDYLNGKFPKEPVKKPKKSKRSKKMKYRVKGSKDEAEEELQSQSLPSTKTIKALTKEFQDLKTSLNKQIQYQKDSQLIEETNKKMKDAERQIERYIFALEIYKMQQDEFYNISDSSDHQDQDDINFVQRTDYNELIVKVLYIGEEKRMNKIWHPLLGEIYMPPTQLTRNNEFNTITVNISVQSLVPMEYSCLLH